MNKIKIFDRRVGFSLGALSILFGTVAPAVVPAFASAETQITSRNIQMSSSVADATGVDYGVNFMPNVGTGSYGVAIQFCDNSPLISTACTAPAGMNVSSATFNGGSASSSGPNFTIGATVAITAATPVAITLHGVTNPDLALTDGSTFYAKVLVYDTAAHALTGLGTLSSGKAVLAIDESDPNLKDAGSVALATTSNIGVQAAVLESLTFCVMGDGANRTDASTDSTNDAVDSPDDATAAGGPNANCQAGGANSDPSVILGKTTGTVTALSTAQPDYQTDWAQISTNAGSGAVVYLKSDLTCAGLSRNSGTDTCAGIPAASGALSAGVKGFGFSFGTTQATTDASTFPKVGSMAVEDSYVSGSYAQLKSGDAAGTGSFASLPVSTTSDSSYGGAVLASTGPVSQNNIPFGIGASIANDTPAGLYKGNFDLIAVATF